MTKIIAIDFDGTIVTHEYPNIGAPVPTALEWIKRFQDEGAFIILWTMRSGEMLDQAVDYLLGNGIAVDAANQNLTELDWTNSPKVLADIYIDDRNSCCPVLQPDATRPAFVNWSLVGPYVMLQIKKGCNPWQTTSPLQRTTRELSTEEKHKAKQETTIPSQENKESGK